MSPTYCIAIKHNNGRLSFLSHRNRSEWTLRTARKHLRDITREKMQDSPKWADVKHFALLAS